MIFAMVYKFVYKFNNLQICLQWFTNLFTNLFTNIFFDHINNLEPSIKFTMETKNDNQLPFMGTLIQRSKNGKLSSSIFRKPTQLLKF